MHADDSKIENSSVGKDVQLIAPTERLRESYFEYLDEFQATSDPYIAKEWEEAHKDFRAFVRRLLDHAEGLNLPPDWLPQRSYWLVRGDRVLGACGLRPELNEALRDFGGNICYGVRPSERRKGYATFMLRTLLKEAMDAGLSKVLLTCDARNAASAAIIKKCGGVLDSESYSARAGRVTRRYWINLAGSGGEGT